MLADGHQEDAHRPLTTRTDASLFEMEIDLLAFVRAFGASSILIGPLPGARAARRMSEQTWIIGGVWLGSAALILLGALAGGWARRSGAGAAPFQATAVRAKAAWNHHLSFGADRDAAVVGGEVAIELIAAGVSFVHGNEGSDRASDEQVVSRIVVVSRVTDERGER